MFVLKQIEGLKTQLIINIIIKSTRRSGWERRETRD